MRYLIECGLLDLLKVAIQEHNNDKKFLVVVVHALSEILRTGHSPQPGVPNTFQAHLETSGVLDEIEKLQTHHNREVYSAVLNLIEEFFEVEDPI